jgi:hypothetical protein
MTTKIMRLSEEIQKLEKKIKHEKNIEKKEKLLRELGEKGRKLAIAGTEYGKKQRKQSRKKSRK